MDWLTSDDEENAGDEYGDASLESTVSHETDDFSRQQDR